MRREAKAARYLEVRDTALKDRDLYHSKFVSALKDVADLKRSKVNLEAESMQLRNRLQQYVLKVRSLEDSLK